MFHNKFYKALLLSLALISPTFVGAAEGDTRINPTGIPQVERDGRWITDFDAISSLDNRFIPVPVSGQLQVNRNYFIQDGDSPILPSPANVGDYIWIDNSTSVSDGYGAPFTGNVQLTATENISTNFVLPPATRVLMRANGSSWTSVLNKELSVIFTDLDDGKELEAGHSYTIIANQDLNFTLPERPFGVIRIELGSNSLAEVTISQHVDNTNQIIQDSFGQISGSRTIQNINKGNQVTIKGDTNPLSPRWFYNEPWAVVNSSKVFWQADVAADTAIPGRLNLYPLGSDLSSHTAPSHVPNGSYSVAIGDVNGEVTSEIKYISNGVVGAGGGWVQQVGGLETRFLEDITFSSVQSAGTNAGSSWGFEVLDVDANSYAPSDWAVTATFTQYTGNAPFAVVSFDRAITSGRLGIGRNKSAPFVKLEYVGQNPNGVSAIITTPLNGASGGDTQVLNYEGTNYSDTFNGSPISWTTNKQVQATDQGAPWIEDAAYPLGAIISHNEENPADANVGDLFNWQVISAITENEFSVWDGTNFSAVQVKLRRFPIGAVSSFDNASPYSPGQDYDEGSVVLYTGTDQEQGIWQATSDVTNAAVNIGNESFIFRGKLPVQDRSRVLPNGTTISMDAFEMATNQSSLRFIVRESETSTFIKNSNPAIVEIIDLNGLATITDTGTSSRSIDVAGPAVVEFQRNSTQFNFIVTSLSLITNDQASSGYIDFGTTRIQWNDEPSANGGTVVFNQPFASTPVITATSTQNPGHNISVLTKSATQFTFDQWDVNNVPQNGTWNWIAIGIKP